jgi:hypothetical protein
MFRDKTKKIGHTLYVSKVVESGVACGQAMPTYTEGNPCKLFNIPKLLHTVRHSLNALQVNKPGGGKSITSFSTIMHR